MSELRTTGVDLSGLLNVLGESLYSTPDVALRELVQNAHDSCNRRRIEAGDFDARIDLRVEDGCLVISDNGSGLTRQEIIDYLATVGAGYTRLLRASDGDPALIGRFGLGFLSAYVIAERVEVRTTSYQNPDQRWRFTSRDGQKYSLDELPADGQIGTTVKLTLKPTSRDLADIHHVQTLARRYCCLLPIPVYAPDRVNEHPPPWRDQALNPVKRQQRELAFASDFDPYFDPLCVIPIEATGEQPLYGLVWLQDGSSYASSDTRQVSLFVRGMLVSDQASDLLPRWAGFAGAVIECDWLQPTASREAIQENDDFKRAQKFIAEAVIDGLARIANGHRETWRRVRRRHNEALLGAALVDERLFEAMHERLTLPTSEGDLAITDILHLGNQRLLLSTGDESGYEQVIQRALRIPVVNGTRYGAAPFTRRCADRLGVELLVLGTRDADSTLFAAESSPHSERLQALFAKDDMRVVTTRFVPASLPLVIVPDRDVMLKRALESDDADRRISGGILSLARQFTEHTDDSVSATVYINLDSRLIGQLVHATPSRQTQLVQLLYALGTMTSQADTMGDRSLATALDDFTSAIDALLSESDDA